MRRSLGALLLALLALSPASLGQLEQQQQQQQAAPAPTGRRLPECPSFCVCVTWHRLPKASCSGRRLYSIHTGVSSLVQALDLSNNSVSQLEDRGLSRTGLTRLKYLNLSMNTISEIGLSAFDDLRNLMVLDLSVNHIDYIAPDTFYYNKNLQMLNLAGNKFNLHVPKLRSTSITELDLSGCRITNLPSDTFEELKVLRKLNLSKNLLTELDKDVLVAVPSLQNLLLGRNYWICNVAMFSLKMYMRSLKIHTDPVCEKPTLEAKLEKIISKSFESSGGLELETRKPAPRAELAESWDMESWREFEEAVREEEQEEEEEEEEEERRQRQRQPGAESGAASGILAGALGNVSPFWFLLTGFLLGSGATMLVTYLWLSTTISCLIPRIRRAETVDSSEVNSQRVSLLRHLWQQNLASPDDSGQVGEGPASVFLPAGAMSAPSCPGTPPPPYREVMLHRNLYPRAAMAAAAQQQAAVRTLPSGDLS